MSKSKPPNNITPTGKLVKQMCIDHPGMPTRGLAKVLIEKHGKHFTDYEHARAMVRYYRGERGVKSRQDVQKIAPSTKHECQLPCIPESDARDVEPYVFPMTGDGLVMSDLHIPYHDPKAIEAAIEHAIRSDATDFLILNGDLLDCYQLSRWNRNPQNRSFASEIDQLQRAFRVFTDEFGKVFYKLGNHEVRYQHYMWAKAPELLGLKQFEWRNIVQADKHGIEIIEDNQVIHAGNLPILHGHEFGESIFSPVNPARGLYLRAKSSALCGHHHATSHHSEGSIDKSVTSCWSLGCLCNLQPKYRPLAYTKWNHGFALLSLEEGGGFEVENRKIVKGKVR